MELQISTSESDIMRVIWQSGGKATVAPLMDELNIIGKQWKSNTVVTFLSRLVDKGLLTVEKNGRNNVYIAVMSETEFRKNQTRAFFKDVYGGNAKEFVASLIEQDHLTLQDLDISEVMVGEAFVRQYLGNERTDNTSISTEDIAKVLRTEIASRKASINTKRKSIIQLEWEIKEDEQRMKDLNALLGRLTNNKVEKSSGGSV